jgi:DNA repair protein RadC
MATKISEIKITYRPTKYQAEGICLSQESEAVFRQFWNKKTIEYYEEFKVMYLNNANQVLGVYNHSSGGIMGVAYDIRMIFQAALKANACAIIIAHNHPSGNLKPSILDIETTRRIKEAGKLLEIKLLDHLILTSSGYMSLMDNGYL